MTRKPTTVKAAKTRCAEEFANWPQVLVIQLNNFTRRMDGGYWLVHGVKTGEWLTAAQVAEVLSINPTVPIEFLSA